MSLMELLVHERSRCLSRGPPSLLTIAMPPDIRLAVPSDADAIRRIYGPIVSETAISFETTVLSVADLESRIASRTQQYPWLVFEQEEDLRGYAVAGPHSGRGAYQWTVDLSAYVHKEFRGAGIGSALYDALFALLEAQGYVRACAVIALPNTPSVRFHERYGFEPVGIFDAVGYKHGSWHDVGWWQRPIRDMPTDPDPPTSIGEIRGTPAFLEALSLEQSVHW